MTSFLPFEEVQDPKYRFSLKNDTLHSLLYPNLYDLKLLQMFLDHESLKLEPKEKNLTRTENVSNVDLKDHREDHQIVSHVEQTHLGRSGVGVGSGSMDSSIGR
jgi:hypothetical protein